MFNSSKIIDFLNKQMTEICILNQNNSHFKHIEIKKNFLKLYSVKMNYFETII
jgi:hypothetical protein